MTRRLYICTQCRSELVYPIAWDEDGPNYWQVVLRCPECEHRPTVRAGESAVEHLDDVLDRGTEALTRELRHFEHFLFEEEIERFVGALHADAILPEDFGRPLGARERTP